MILITGGMGFIGTWTGKALAAHDDVVLGYNRSIRSEEELQSLIGAKVAAVQIDVTSAYSVNRALAQYKPSGIVHLAVPALGAMPPAEESLANVQGLMNILEGARSHGVTRVSLASSLAVYSGLTGGPFTEDIPLPMLSTNPTSAMKKAEEVLALHHADRTGMDLRVLRIGGVYGPLYHTLANQPSKLTHLAVRGSIPKGRNYSWTPQQLLGGLDLIHVHDCAALIAAIHTADSPAHRIYNVGGGASVSADELIEAVEAAVPGAVLPDEVRHTGTRENVNGYMDISRVVGEFGVAPQHDVRSGIRQYAEWLRDHSL